MSKCLVTKLKASVNNPDLPIFGAIEITLNPGGYMDGGSIKTCTGQSAVLLFPDGTKVEINDTNDFKYKDIAETTKVLFISKYEAFPIAGSIDDFKNTLVSISEIRFQTGHVFGNIENLGSHPELTIIELNGCPNLTGNLANLTRLFPNLTQLNLYSSGISGNVAECGKWNLSSNYTVYFSTTNTGNIYDAIVGWRTKKEAIQLNVMCCGDDVTLFNTALPKAKVCKLTWTDTTVSVEIENVKTTYNNDGNIIP